MKKISAKRLREQLEAKRIHNDHGFSKVVSPTPPMISHQTSQRWHSSNWRVWRVGVKVNPNAHWSDNGAQSFIIQPTRGETPGQAKIRTFTEAIAWASEKYGYTPDEWVKAPFGAWMPKDALEQALRFHLPELFDGEVAAPKPTRDPVVKRITDKLYGETELKETEPFILPLDADGWYRVVGSGVAVFIHATTEEDALKRVKFMVQRMSMDASLEWSVSKRDPEVY